MIRQRRRTNFNDQCDSEGKLHIVLLLYICYLVADASCIGGILV